MQRGGVRTLRKEFRAALADYDESLKYVPEEGKAWAGRGYLKVLMGHYREAVADLDNAIRRAPRLSIAYESRGRARRTR